MSDDAKRLKFDNPTPEQVEDLTDWFMAHAQHASGKDFGIKRELEDVPQWYKPVIAHNALQLEGVELEGVYPWTLTADQVDYFAAIYVARVKANISISKLNRDDAGDISPLNRVRGVGNNRARSGPRGGLS